jgi:hypothetical protein
MVAFVLLILTLICFYFTVINRKYIYTFLFINLFVDSAWIIYHWVNSNTLFAIIWGIILVFDYINYSKLTEN